jgi:hypothetical protein
MRRSSRGRLHCGKPTPAARREAFQKPLRTTRRKLLNPRDRRSLNTVFRRQMFLAANPNEMSIFIVVQSKVRPEHRQAGLGGGVDCVCTAFASPAREGSASLLTHSSDISGRFGKSIFSSPRANPLSPAREKLTMCPRKPHKASSG